MSDQDSYTQNPLAQIEDDMRGYISRYLELGSKYREYVNKTEAETARMLLDLLEVLDGFDLAMEKRGGQTVPGGDERTLVVTKSWLNKLARVHKKYHQALKRCGLEPLRVKSGEKADLNRHVVVREVKKRGLEDGVITAVVKQGYAIKGKLLRASAVKVVNNRQGGRI